MTGDEKIKQLIKGLSGNGSLRSAATIIGTVKALSNDKTYATIDIADGLEIDEVRLKSIVDEDNKGLYVVPKVGTKVMLLRIGSSDTFYCVACEQYEKVVIRGENTSLEIDNNLIIFNDNELNSFALDINKLKDKINTLEQQLNDLKEVFRNWTPVAQDGGAKLKLGVTSWAATDIVETTVDDIKDPKIKN